MFFVCFLFSLLIFARVWLRRRRRVRLSAVCVCFLFFKAKILVQVLCGAFCVLWNAASADSFFFFCGRWCKIVRWRGRRQVVASVASATDSLSKMAAGGCSLGDEERYWNGEFLMFCFKYMLDMQISLVRLVGRLFDRLA